MARTSALRVLAAGLASLFTLLAPPGAWAAKSSGTLVISGAGAGHGIGMSQYGAMGYAEHGWNDEAILAHYYQGTSLGKVGDSTVTVLIGQGAATFMGASAANGFTLKPSASYGVLVIGHKLALISGGRRSGTFDGPLTVSGPHLSVVGKGRYDGKLEFFPTDSGGVLTVNAVGLEDYVRGVVGEEMSSSWPQQALDAQAIAARTYVLAGVPVSSQYDVYADARSQMYGGVGAETPSTDLAASVTDGQVVEDDQRIIPTYFFSSSGGSTESIQNVWLGVSPAPYLVGVDDPYDSAGHDPYHRWKDTLSISSAAHRLAGLYTGSFEGIKVLHRGVSPRIISAAVIGSRGRSTVSGATLQDDLGTMSTWMSFTTVTAHGVSSSGSGRGTIPSSGASGTGGAGIGAAQARVPRRVVTAPPVTLR